MDLSPWRYRLTTDDARKHQGEGARTSGAMFRTCREALSLSPYEVAQGWDVEVGHVIDLEDGRLCFPCPADAKCALDQLWLWAAQKHPRQLIETRWP